MAFSIQSRIWADAPGSASFDFLKLGGSARVAAMGGAGTSLGGEAMAAQSNPAALSDLKAPEAYFSYQRLFDDLSYGNAGYARPTNRYGSLGLDLQYLNYGTIAAADAQGTRTGTISASDRQLRAGWAGAFGAWTPGASVKAVQEQLDSVTATAFALDAGLLVHPPSERLANLTFGAAVLNVGIQARFEGSSEKLPRSARVGASWRGFADRWTTSLDFENAAGRRQAVTVHWGAEAWLQDAIALRLGYRTDAGIGLGLGGGIGIKAGDWRIDYAFMPFGALGDTHRIAATYRFGGGALRDYYEAGVREMRLGHYPEAVILFDKALAIDPHDPRVLRKAMEAAKAMGGMAPKFP